MTRPRLNVKIGLACGLLSPLVFAVLYIIAISQDPNYAFYENYLSDLGVGPGAWAFNSGVMIAGTLAVVFAQLGLRKAFGRGVLYALSTGLLSLGGLFCSSSACSPRTPAAYIYCFPWPSSSPCSSLLAFSLPRFTGARSSAG